MVKQDTAQRGLIEIRPPTIARSWVGSCIAKLLASAAAHELNEWAKNTETEIWYKQVSNQTHQSDEGGLEDNMFTL